MTQEWTPRNLRQKPRISYYEPDEPDLDQYVFCEKCGDFVYEYCSIHGPLLVIPDNKVCLDAGLGVFSSLTLPSGVRFGPYRGQRTDVVDSSYCWQIYDKNRKPLHCVDAADANKSNWMRYVNCARHWREQNLVAYQYQGELYYRTIKIIPRFTELMVFYGSEYACELDVDLGKYNSPAGYAQKFGAPVAKKRKQNDDNTKTANSEATATNVVLTTEATDLGSTLKDITTEPVKRHVNIHSIAPEHVEDNYEKSTKADEAKATPSKKNKATKNKQAFQIDKVTKITQTKQSKQTENKTSIVKPKITNIKDSKSRNNATDNNDTDKAESIAKEVTTNILDFYIFCDDCNKKCVSKQELQTHQRFHDLSRAYACEICSLRYTSLGHLNIHINGVHTKHKNYVCEVCDKSFNEICNLKTHRRVHTGERPYKCDLCEKSFTQMFCLKNHRRVHTGERPYKCDLCEKSFTVMGHLKTHRRVHTGERPYKCDLCEKSFTVMGHLKTHRRVHTGERPYKCDLCEKSFNQMIHLKTHRRVHTGEKPYICEICNTTFSCRNTLKNHIMKIHLANKRSTGEPACSPIA